MQGLSPKKKFLIIKLYLSGLSYSEIETKACVSKGSVANVISDLKAGLFPEAEAPPEQLELLRELATDLHHLKLTPAQAGAGLAALAHLNELGIEPGNIQKWAAMCKQLASEHTDTHTFVKAALYLEEIRNLTGLTPESLEEKVHTLQQEVASLEVSAAELKGCPAQLEQLKNKARALGLEIGQLEKQRNALSKDVGTKEKRAEKLSKRIESLEGKALAAEERLSTANKSLKTLAELGLSPEELPGFVARISNVASKHSMKPSVIRDRLLHELEQLQIGLGLDSTVERRRKDLAEIEQKIAKARETALALESSLQQLQQHQTTLRTQITVEQEHLHKEVQAMTEIVKGALTVSKGELEKGVNQALLDVENLRDQTLALGQELGYIESTIQAKEWVRKLAALVNGDDNIKAEDVRITGLLVMYRIRAQIDTNQSLIPNPYSLSKAFDTAIRELEKWKS